MSQVAQASEITDDGVDLAEVRRHREDHVFDTQTDFSTPVIIRGTNHVFRQSRSLKVVKNPSSADLDQLIDQCRQIDSHLNLIRVRNASAIKLDTVTPDLITFHLDSQPNTLYYLDTPVTRKDPLAFKRLCSLVSIPFSFTKKSPAFLNKMNLDYYLRLVALNEKAPAIDLIFETTASEITYAPDEATDEEVTVKAFRLVNVLNVPRGRGRTAAAAPATDDEAALSSPPIATRLPLFSDILSGVRTQLQNYPINLNPVLQTYATGYDGDNKGRHFARILFDTPETSFDTGGNPFQLALNIETDFSGDGDDFGNVRAYFVLFRQICSNGLVASWSTQDKAQMREKFVLEQLTAAGYGATDTADEAVQIRKDAEARFHMLFEMDGLSIPVALANGGLDVSIFTIGLDFFIDSKQFMQDRLNDLAVEFGKIDEEEFVTTVLSLQKAMKLKSPELVKAFILEYLAGEITGHQSFKSPADVVNFLTLMARAYESDVITDIERKAIPFAMDLYQSLTKAQEQASVSLAAQYRAQLNARLLTPDSAE